MLQKCDKACDTRHTYEKKRKKGPVVFSSLEATD